MNYLFQPGKLLICIVGRHRGEQLMGVAKAAGARGGTIALGRSLMDSRILRALALADIQQDIVFTLMGPETDVVFTAIREAAAKSPKKLGGTALLLDVAGMFIRLRPGMEGLTRPAMETEGEMDSNYTLVSIIVNNGFADDVMAVARKAGAGGGTILNARGTGTEEDVKFFGISLVPEKEMLLIVADKSKVEGIVEAVNAIPALCEPGGGIVYTMNVERFVILGQNP